MWEIFVSVMIYLGIPFAAGVLSSQVLRPAMGPDGFWIGLISGLTAAAIMLTLRLRRHLRPNRSA